MLRPGDVTIVLPVRDGHVPLALHEDHRRMLARRARGRRGRALGLPGRRAGRSALMRGLLRAVGARLVNLVEQLVVAALNGLRFLIGLHLDLASRTARRVLARGGSRSVGRRSRGDVLRDALHALRLLLLGELREREVGPEIAQIVQRALNTLVLALRLRLHLSSRTLKVLPADVERADAGRLLVTRAHALFRAALRALRLVHRLCLNVALLLRRVLRVLREVLLLALETLLVDVAAPTLGSDDLPRGSRRQEVLERGGNRLAISLLRLALERLALIFQSVLLADEIVVLVLADYFFQ